MSGYLPVILVIDPDDRLNNSIIDLADELGHVAIGAADAPVAMRFIEMLPSLRLVLSELHLRTCTGPDLIRQAMRNRPGLKVVFIGNDDSGVTIRHSDRLLWKPLRIRDVRTIISETLGTNEAVDGGATRKCA